MNDFCFFIISTEKNTPVVNYMLEKLNEFQNAKYDVYVSFDTDNSDVKIIQRDNIHLLLNTKNITCFGNRINDALLRVPYTKVIVMCDDFIVEEKINEKELIKLSNIMEKDNLITNFILSKVTAKYKKDNIDSKYFLRPKFGQLKTSLQCGLWNKNALMYLMKDIKSPWDFEIYANYRSFSSLNKFYALAKHENKPILYNGGYFVVRGKIVRKELERLQLKLNENIEIKEYPYWDGEFIKDPTSIPGKVYRRIKISMKSIKYVIISLFKKVNINNL
ncbi:hypothetical protein [Metabacillus litoralis]|uniref:hypothetical protein n=1 Tax=Metabacillus litoralis TaxID=152268 RepID=UPI002041A864|nr:hypothetical protein [Metabacillus litoralis]MCM3163750.1 hypothetical protein [Metabacillus litoralis]